VDVGDGGQRGPGVWQGGLAGGGQAHRAARPVQQRLAEFTFQPLDLGADRRLRDVDPFDVVAANREMHVTGATQRPEDLARVTGKYREDTDADKVRR
jgi:hypothetical protein